VLQAPRQHPPSLLATGLHLTLMPPHASIKKADPVLRAAFCLGAEEGTESLSCAATVGVLWSQLCSSAAHANQFRGLRG
jgi:hypothetical protein